MQVDTNSSMCGRRRERIYECRIPPLFEVELDGLCSNIGWEGCPKPSAEFPNIVADGRALLKPPNDVGVELIGEGDGDGAGVLEYG